jgi:flagellin
MQINNNIPAFNVWTNYTKNVTNLRKSMSKLSSGSRINNAGDDPSGLAMSERLRTQKRNTAAAAGNVENKLNYLQTADSWTQKIHDMLGRMGELAVMANDGTKSTVDRTNLQKEFTQMQAEITRIAGSAAGDETTAAKFNGIALFQGGDAIKQQVGADGGQVFESSFTLDFTGTSTDPLTDAVGSQTWSNIIEDSSADITAEALVVTTNAALVTANDAATETQANLDAVNDAIGMGTVPLIGTNTITEAIAALNAADPVGNADQIDRLNTVAGVVTGGAAATLTFAGGAAVGSYGEVDAAADLVASDASDDRDDAVTAVGLTTSIRINSTDNAEAAVTSVNDAIDFLSGKRADIGAEMKRMEHTLDGLRTYEENIGATESRIRDVDVAKETSEMSKYSILQQVGTAMLAQANQMPQGVLQLLG